MKDIIEDLIDAYRNQFKDADKSRNFYMITSPLDKTHQIAEYAYIADDWMLIGLATFNCKYDEIAWDLFYQCQEQQTLLPAYNFINETNSVT